ncbi:MAG TPA: response regulator [Candidatus Sulfotelmatobacter sp.]|jgi:CheY-like chemotaxis protein
MNNLGHILLVDDDDNDLELTRRTLVQNKLANEIVVLHDGEEALNYLFRRGQFNGRPSPDPMLVLLDIKMPKVDGIEVLVAVKKDPLLREIPVVMLTSSREGPDVEQCYRHRANAYVVKPVDFAQFADAVRTIGKFWGVLNERPGKKAQASTAGH